MLDRYVFGPPSHQEGLSLRGVAATAQLTVLSSDLPSMLPSGSFAGGFDCFSDSIRVGLKASADDRTISDSEGETT